MPWSYCVAYPVVVQSVLDGWGRKDTASGELQVDGMVIRRLRVKYDPIRKRQVYRMLPAAMQKNKADRRSILEHFRNAWLNRVVAFKTQMRDGQLSELQKRLSGQHTRASILEIFANRRLEVHLTKSDLYLQARVSALRRWTWACITIFQISPWRHHVWPRGQDPTIEFSEDFISLTFVTEASMRYTSHKSCTSCWMHVREFHRCILDATPGQHPRTDHFLERLKPVLLKENPDGRRERHGFEPQEYHEMCACLR